MDLSERAKIKQDIVKETGYKTTVKKQENRYCVDKNNEIEHYRCLDSINRKTLAKLFTYKNEKYEIYEWREGIAVRNLKDENDIRYIYGLNIDTPLKVSALNGNSYNIDELFIILTKMFDDNVTNCVPYIS